MSHPFNDPATSTGIDLKALHGALLLFTVHAVERGIVTSFGPTDAVKCDVVVLDGADKGTVYDNTLIFPKVLQSQLAPSVGGGKVIGRLGQGQAKPGQSAPWTLTAATDEDKAVGVRYLEYVASQQVTTPAAQPF